MFEVLSRSVASSRDRLVRAVSMGRRTCSPLAALTCLILWCYPAWQEERLSAPRNLLLYTQHYSLPEQEERPLLHCCKDKQDRLPKLSIDLNKFPFPRVSMDLKRFPFPRVSMDLRRFPFPRVSMDLKRFPFPKLSIARLLTGPHKPRPSREET